jgi:hypothetical protein
MIDEAALAAEFSTRGGVSTRVRLRERGLTDRQIDRLIANGRVIKAGRGVLVDSCSPARWLREVAVACAAIGGVASHHTALRVWGFPGVPPTNGKHVTIGHDRRVVAPSGVVVHRCRDIDECDIVQHDGGFAVWSPPRSLVDAGGIVDGAGLERMIDHALAQQLCTIHTIAEVCGRAWHPARPGSCALARTLHSRPAWLKPVRSSYEQTLERALLRAGFPPLVREHPVVLLDGDVVHPDLGIPNERFFIEIDHPTWHGGLDNAYDRARDLEVERAGNCVKRVPTTSIDARLDDTVAVLVELRRRWLRSPGAPAPAIAPPSG